MTATLKAIVPVFRVADVDRSMKWYAGVLGFGSDPFPANPPYEFAILTLGGAEIMLRKWTDYKRPEGAPGWDAYFRLEGGAIRAVYERFSKTPYVARRLERMPYGYAEFEIRDTDGYRLCFGEAVDKSDDIPNAVE